MFSKEELKDLLAPELRETYKYYVEHPAADQFILHFSDACLLPQTKLYGAPGEFSWGNVHLSGISQKAVPCRKCAYSSLTGLNVPALTVLLASPAVDNGHALGDVTRRFLNKELKNSWGFAGESLVAATQQILAAREVLFHADGKSDIIPALTFLHKVLLVLQSYATKFNIQQDGKPAACEILRKSGKRWFEKNTYRYLLLLDTDYEKLFKEGRYSTTYATDAYENPHSLLCFIIWVFGEYSPSSKTWKARVPTRILLLSGLTEKYLCAPEVKSISKSTEETAAAFMRDGLTADEAVLTALAL